MGELFGFRAAHLRFSSFAQHFPDPRNPKGLEPDPLPGAEAEATGVAQLLTGLGYTFTSETDTEVIAHLVRHHLNSKADLLDAVRAPAASRGGQRRRASPRLR